MFCQEAFIPGGVVGEHVSQQTHSVLLHSVTLIHVLATWIVLSITNGSRHSLPVKTEVLCFWFERPSYSHEHDDSATHLKIFFLLKFVVMYHYV